MIQDTRQIDEQQFFQSDDDVTLMYRRSMPAQQATGNTVVLLHGAASNSTRWWHFVEHTRLSADRVLLRPDLRGSGESMWRGTAGIDHWVQDIAAMLRHEQQTHAIVLGHCLGANIALNFAARYPEMCAGLILVEPMANEALTGILARLKPFVPLFRFIVKILNLLNQTGLYRRRLKTIDLKKLDYRVHQANPENRLQALSDHGSPWQDIKITPTAQYINNFIALMEPLPVTHVKCPGLIIQASGQSLTDAVKTKALFSQLPGMKFVEIETEHWIPASHPVRLCELVDDWVLNNPKNLG